MFFFIHLLPQVNKISHRSTKIFGNMLAWKPAKRRRSPGISRPFLIARLYIRPFLSPYSIAASINICAAYCSPRRHVSAVGIATQFITLILLPIQLSTSFYDKPCDYMYKISIITSSCHRLFRSLLSVAYLTHFTLRITVSNFYAPFNPVPRSQFRRFVCFARPCCQAAHVFMLLYMFIHRTSVFSMFIVCTCSIFSSSFDVFVIFYILCNFFLLSLGLSSHYIRDIHMLFVVSF